MKGFFMGKGIPLEKGNIFKFTRVTDYLSYWYKVNSRNNPEFQYRTLAEWIGCRSTSELFRIFSEKKLPSYKMVHRLIKLMDLTIDEANYFILLTHLSYIRMRNKDKEVYLKRYKSLLRKAHAKKH